MNLLKGMISRLFTLLIRFYQQAISPYLMPACRFTPSCSEYGIQAIAKYGPFKGGWMAVKRFSSCHPWGRHGHDPVK